jgi:hypothetical protein
VNKPRLLFRVHAIQRMVERGITVKQVRRVWQMGETIEDYSSSMPEPGRLILGSEGRLPIHLVISEAPNIDVATVITVYNPDPDQWKPGFKARRS